MNNLNLNSLRVFAFAARHGSFKVAGEVLNISHGAVSQRIKQLELFLGVSLFDRTPRGVTLTPVGEGYYKSIEPALAALADATAEVQGTTQEITLHVPPSLASKWLMHNLPDFSRQFPGIRVSTVALEGVVDRPFGRNEVAIRHAASFRPSQGQDYRQLTELQLVAVCRPDLKPSGSSVPLKELLAMPLLQDAHRRWDRLIERTGTEKPRDIVSFNRTALAIDAAINGQGAAIAPTFLVDRDIQDGRLVELWRDSEGSGEFLFLIWSDQHSRSAALSKFVNWVQSVLSVDGPSR